MPDKLSFWNSLKTCGDREYLQKNIAYATAPILRGLKPAELLSLQFQRKGCLTCFQKNKDSFFRALGLSFLEIRERENSLLLLIYDREQLEKRLAEIRQKALLTSRGYLLESSLDRVLAHLKSRFGRESFPHEVGLFLGYPEKDVASFIALGGENFSYCRHWKVYHDVPEAKRTMLEIDASRHAVITLLMRNLSMTYIAKTLKHTSGKEQIL